MPSQGLPVVTFEQGLALHVNGERARVVHDPSSHTDGDSAVFFEGSKVVHMGDLFFAARFPFVDLDSGGSVRGLARSIDSILAEITSEWRIIPGHGPVSTVDDLRTYRAMLGECTELVEKALARGASAADMNSEKLFAKYESWGAGFIRTDAWIDTLVREIATERR
jgi:glyoxylase-like metal-dependent hydrolase (beta-lactamase superfamily II)